MTKRQALKVLCDIRKEFLAKQPVNDFANSIGHGMADLIRDFDERTSDDPAAELKDFGFKGSFLPGTKITIELPEAP